MWITKTYTVRVPGRSAWEMGLLTYGAARESQERANRVNTPGHRIYAEQVYVGDLESLQGETRTVLRSGPGTFGADNTKS